MFSLFRSALILKWFDDRVSTRARALLRTVFVGERERGFSLFFASWAASLLSRSTLSCFSRSFPLFQMSCRSVTRQQQNREIENNKCARRAQKKKSEETRQKSEGGGKRKTRANKIPRLLRWHNKGTDNFFFLSLQNKKKNENRISVVGVAFLVAKTATLSTTLASPALPVTRPIWSTTAATRFRPNI